MLYGNEHGLLDFIVQVCERPLVVVFISSLISQTITSPNTIKTTLSPPATPPIAIPTIQKPISLSYLSIFYHNITYTSNFNCYLSISSSLSFPTQKPKSACPIGTTFLPSKHSDSFALSSRSCFLPVYSTPLTSKVSTQYSS